MKKRLAALGMCFCIMVLMLSGCGSSGSGNSEATSAPEKTTAAEAEKAEPAETEAAKAPADYPAKTITVIVPFGAGGEHDMTARVMAARLQEMFGWTVVVQNTSGASVAAMEYYNDKKNTDGYTLFMHSPEVMASSYVGGDIPEPLYEKFTYLGNFVYDPMVICVSADSPYNTLEELLEAAKADPKGINWASVSAAGKNVMDAQNFWKIAGVEFNYVPYDNASESRVAVLGGHDDVYHAYASGAKASVDAGELKCLAVGSAERLEFWPDVPTLKECGFDLQVGLTRCWDIHPDVEQGIKDLLTEKLHECWADEATQKKLTDMGQSPSWMTDEEMREYGEYYYTVYSDFVNQ